MRGGDRVEEFVTTDLLAVWTDPDTAMEAVGAGLGIFPGRVPEVRRVLATDTPLRRALYAVLLDLVDGGALEKRATADGRYAFRWRSDLASAALRPAAGLPELAVRDIAVRDIAVRDTAVRDTVVPDIDLTALDPPDADRTAGPESVAAPEPVVASRPAVTPAAIAEPVRSGRPRVAEWMPHVVAPAAPLLFPAISCIVAILAFLWLPRLGGLIIAAGLTVVGMVGLARRVPFAGLWIAGVLVAGILLRFS